MSSSFTGTITSGIQDISALLPLVGTEQCEYHIGSALDGGYMYAAVAPLSIFGSLGVVQAGLYVLLSESISGSLLYKNAGFEPKGRLAEGLDLIGTPGKDGQYYVEEKLQGLLDDQHLDDPDKLEIPWQWNVKWNYRLIIYTLIVAIISLIPYIHLILIQLRSHSAIGLGTWGFPLLRSFGSAGVTIISQILL
jgi:hypothetical protein